MLTDSEFFDALPQRKEALVQEIRKAVIGQDDVVEQLLVALFSSEHCLLIGVPGLAKTLLINTVAQALGLSFGRVQFTPDMMPSDITGSEILQEDKSSGDRQLIFQRGPVFTNLLLADEINRTPPKTQAALLQAMQERQVTAGRETMDLEPPFLVFATQNPIEQEGTYPLPEAQLDRFMFSVVVGYPTEEEELAIVSQTTVGKDAEITPVLQQDELIRYQKLLRQLPTSDNLMRYAVRLVRASRPDTTTISAIKEFVHWGAGPRASQFLVVAAKVRAALHGHSSPSIEDVQAVAPSVLRHRMVRNFKAEAQNVSPEDLVAQLIAGVSAT